MQELNFECERCGLCCKGYTFWMTNRSYDNDPKGIRKLAELHGLTVLRNKQGELGINVPSTCEYYYEEEGKSCCKAHGTDNQPLVCKEYYCSKVIEKGLANGFHI